MQPPRPTERHADAEQRGAIHELGRTGRTVGVVLWTSFLAAGLATTVCFALFDPASLADTPLASDMNTHRLAVYAGGFFFFWLICIASAGLTALMLQTERSRS
jgi:hypothetical protein